METVLKTYILLFDLDGTLLRSDKTISERTLSAIERCRASGNLVGSSTSRGETNCEQFIKQLNPDAQAAECGDLNNLPIGKPSEARYFGMLKMAGVGVAMASVALATE